MDEKQKKHQFIHVPPVEEAEDNKCLNETSENDGDDAVPLGLTGKAVCMQVNTRPTISHAIPFISLGLAPFTLNDCCESHLNELETNHFFAPFNLV